ncbi:MAG: peptidoglycan-associated lipoprotein Pal [Thermodesulfobacteriota bacterium]|nr:MAG: peptidoglycan-associated lipoprotein Pal [Thermodesulfobacteriota bacterium]
MKKFLKLLPILLVALTLTACKGKTLIKEETAGLKAGEAKTEVVPEERVEEGTLGGETAGITGNGVEEAETGAEAAITGLRTVHFDFDKYTIRDEDKKILAMNAKWLRLNPDVRVRIEGHADERGENEYNLALGEKRAMTVKNYLKRLGVDANRISIISYGEEKPLDPGHNEEAWAKNRRAEFKKIR